MSAARTKLAFLMFALVCRPSVMAAVNEMHPEFVLLDSDGVNVLTSGKPLATARTCNACHDVSYIESNNFHIMVGNYELAAILPGGQANADESSSRLATSTQPAVREWLAAYGRRHAGGGLAREAGLEIDCLLCHLANANYEERAAEIAALAAGQPSGWLNSAVLLGTGLLGRTERGFEWQPQAFTEEGRFPARKIPLQDPSAATCGFCHGYVSHGEKALLPKLGDGLNDTTEHTGSIFAEQRLCDSALNLADKDKLTLSWDVHAERLLKCANCHHSLNNPVYQAESTETKPKHLVFDSRRIAFNDYLHRPSHQLARGPSAESFIAPEFRGSMRRCDSCHSLEVTHEWLPYKQRHMLVLSCEACHIPYVHFTAQEQVDETVVGVDGQPVVSYRNAEGDVGDPETFYRGFQPVLLPRNEIDGKQRLAPYNLVSTWFWVAGDAEAPVSRQLLRAAFLQDAKFRPEIVSLLDLNGDGLLSHDELRLNSDVKVQAVAAALQRLGLSNPHIKAETRPYSLDHGVAKGKWALKNCSHCHGDRSYVYQDMELAGYLPGGILPQLIKDTAVRLSGLTITSHGRGAVLRRQRSEGRAAPWYVLGSDRLPVVTQAGLLSVIAAFGLAVVHGGLRYRAARRPRSSRDG